jgi:hypothetical protein
MTQEQLFRHAARIERKLRAEGVPSIEIPAIIGAAFMASLTNLTQPDRMRVLAAHVEAVRLIAEDVVTSPQAPDSPFWIP